MRAVMRRIVLPNSLLVRLPQQGVSHMCRRMYLIIIFFCYFLTSTSTSSFSCFLFSVVEPQKPTYATHEEAKQAFKELLKETVNFVFSVHMYQYLIALSCVCVCVCVFVFGIQNLASTTTWDQAMKQIINDPRYMYVATPIDPPT